MQAVADHGKDDWQTNLGLKPEPDDEGLYTETQVQKMRESFEQSVTDPENQPSQYGTVPMKEWVGLTDEEIEATWKDSCTLDNGEGANLKNQPFYHLVKLAEAKLKEKNA